MPAQSKDSLAPLPLSASFASLRFHRAPPGRAFPACLSAQGCGSVRAMDWYYSEAGRQVGPVADGPFEELLRIGKVTGLAGLFGILVATGMESWTLGVIAAAALLTGLFM